jgi:Ca2+-binding EF-hand superfamily protein
MEISSLGSSSANMSMMGMSRRKPPSSDEMASKMVESQDKDGDGSLSLVESGMSEDMFNQIDTDGDGKIAAGEISTDMESRRKEMEAQGGSFLDQMSDSTAMTRQILSNLDQDVSGGLSLKESSLSQEQFNALDVNGDGSISGDEISSALDSLKSSSSQASQITASNAGSALSSLLAQMQSTNASSMAQQFLKQMDGDSDGSLSAAEAKMPDKLFAKIDSNGDGQISADELSADFAAHMKEAHAGFSAQGMDAVASSAGSSLQELLSSGQSGNDLTAQALERLMAQGLGAYSKQMDSFMTSFFNSQGSSETSGDWSSLALSTAVNPSLSLAI